MENQRSEIRMMCADVVQASWRDQDGRLQQADALLENISPSGACLEFEIAVPTGAILHFKTGAQEFIGKVCYCTYQEIGYFVGLAFEPQSHWSRRAFRPQHLLDLQELAANTPKPER